MNNQYTEPMDIHTDVWTGESLLEITQIMTEFRHQIGQYVTHDYNSPSMSEAFVTLQDYLSNDAIVIVANDSNQFAGYITLVDITDDHPNAMPYAYLDSDVKVSAGPFIHPNYRDTSIESQLLTEAMNECSLRGILKVVVDMNQDPLATINRTEDLLKKRGFTLNSECRVWEIDVS